MNGAFDETWIAGMGGAVLIVATTALLRRLATPQAIRDIGYRAVGAVVPLERLPHRVLVVLVSGAIHLSVPVAGLAVTFTLLLALQPGTLDVPGVLLAASAGCLAVLVLWASYLGGQGELKRRRDAHAALVRAQCRRGEPPSPFVLISRPLALDEQVTLPRPLCTGLFAAGEAFGAKEHALMIRLSWALEPDLPCLVIGNSTEANAGLGSIAVPPQGDCWWHEFRLLAPHAKRIVAVPIVSTRQSGVLQELRELFRTGAIEKTVFVMPPTARLAARRLGSRKLALRGAMRRVWSTSRSLLREHLHLDLPIFQPRGGWLLPVDAGHRTWRHTDGLSGNSWWSARTMRLVVGEGRVRDSVAREGLRFAWHLAVVSPGAAALVGLLLTVLLGLLGAAPGELERQLWFVLSFGVYSLFVGARVQRYGLPWWAWFPLGVLAVCAAGGLLRMAHEVLAPVQSVEWMVIGWVLAMGLWSGSVLAVILRIALPSRSWTPAAPPGSAS